MAPPSLDTTGMLRYDRIGTIHGDPVTPMPVANGSGHTGRPGYRYRRGLARHRRPADRCPIVPSVEIRTLGRAAARQAPVPNAVGGRSAAHLLNVYAAPDPALSDIERLAAVRAVSWTLFAQWSGPIELINFVGRANGADAVLRSWSPDQNNRLDAIRGRRDPAGMLPFGRHQGK